MPISIRTLPGSKAPALACLVALLVGAGAVAGEPVDFNREIRPILSNRCYACHGPDPAKRQGVGKPLRLDTEAGAFEDLGGYAAVVRGKPDESELILRVRSDDPNEVMPPPKHAAKLPPAELERLARWVEQGAKYARHWSYARPTRPPVPVVEREGWSKNPVDAFLLARMAKEGLAPSPEADREALIRRVALDLTGLPPTPAEVDAYRDDPGPDAYGRLVDALLARPSYGEHAARLWLDLARYADSSGYADDPSRTIWGYRDYVIRSFNANKPFDRFTLEQLAGDLLPDATDETRIATAFHRNTTTNNEGGTVDEEFRNAAIVDRVNTTMAVWMGTTIACAQCHDHKFDPLSQADFFRLFAFFNNTQDADRGDESPTLAVESTEQKRKRAELKARIESLEKTLETPTPETDASLARWRNNLEAPLAWKDLDPAAPPSRLAGLRLEFPAATGPKSPGAVVVRVVASVVPPGGATPIGRYVRVELPGREKMISLAEVQAFRGGENVAAKGEASQSTTAFDGSARLAIDGNTDGDFATAKSTTQTAVSDDPWWEVDLKQAGPVDRLVIWSRTDGGLQSRLDGAKLVILDEARKPAWSRDLGAAPKLSVEFATGGGRPVAFVSAFDDGSAAPADILTPKSQGWPVPPGGGRLILLPAEPLAIEPGSTLSVTVEPAPKPDAAPADSPRLAWTADDRAPEFARLPPKILEALRSPDEARRAEVAKYYRASVAPETKLVRDELAGARKDLAGLKPETTVPVLAELPAGARRKTRIQLRGNYLDLGSEVAEGVPEAIATLPADAPRDRLALARWLMSDDNPMTARVVANRAWEQVFGAGLVPTGEEFGSQGEPPTHPELLDWLATELVASHWDLKALLRLLVTSAAYRQSSKVKPEGLRLDPANQWIARGPRFRLPAETVRDQALAVAGLLSPRMYGPPVRPPQPASGLAAAFGGKIDWQTSMGDDKFRRGLYTTWRRSNPYPSMATFDAPNREVCTVRRSRTNTPLQALVTLNDPVYVEAAQGLARRMAGAGKAKADRARFGLKLCLSREATDREIERLVRLHDDAYSQFAGDPDGAKKLATDPLGPAPEGSDLADLAAWTVVANVLLNLDETLMRR